MSEQLVLTSEEHEKEIELIKDALVIGRLPNADLTIPDMRVSKKHCRISRGNGGFVVEDLNSVNGTKVNGRTINRSLLQDGDRLQIADTEISVEIRSSSTTSSSSSDKTSRTEAPTSGNTTSYNVVQNTGEAASEAQEELISTLTGDPVSEETQDLSDTLDKQVDPFEILFKLSQQIHSRVGFDEVLESTVHLIDDVFSPRRCVILSIPLDKNEPVPQVNWNREEGFADVEDIEISWSITNKVIDENVSIVSKNPMEDTRFDKGDSISNYQIRAAMCVPLWENDEVFGAIYLDFGTEREDLSDEDLDLLAAISNQVAIRIKQEQFHEKMQQEAVVRKNFERFHSPDVAEAILEQSMEGKEIPQELSEGELSLLFVDIERFTELADRIQPMRVANLLNEFYDFVSEIVFEYDGAIDKYLGDGVLAVFGAPVHIEFHALQAVQAGKKITDSISKLNEDLPADLQYRVRVGINSGAVVHGYVGSSEVKEFTVIGTPVIIADRLQNQAKPNDLLLGERTVELLDGAVDVTSAGSIPIKGRTDDITSYELDV